MDNRQHGKKHAHQEGDPLDGSKPVPCFIGGSGQTGKTTLKRLLIKHPRVAAFRGESRIIVDPDGLLSFLNVLDAHPDPYQYDVAVHRLERTLKLAGGPRFHATVAKRDSRGQDCVRKLVSKATRSLRRSGYASVNLSEDVPRYRELTEEFVASLGSKYSGRWIGMPRSRDAFITLPPRDIELVRDRVHEYTQALIRHVIAKRPEATHFVDDTPYSALRFKDLLRLYPNAKLIYMSRAENDVIRATMDKRWAPQDPELSAELLGYIRESWRRVRKHVPREAYMEMTYEELASDNEAALSRAEDFLGLPPHSSYDTW